MASAMRSLIVMTMLALTWLGASAAHACTCTPPPPPKAALERATAVFEGRTFRSKPIAGDRIRWEFEVVRYWKGELEPTVSVVSHRNSVTCGRHYESGKTYLVYAQGSDDDELKDNLCSRTRRLSEASEDLEVLGSGKTPTAADSEVSGDGQDREPPRIQPPPREPPAPSPSRRGCAIASETPAVIGLLAILPVVAFRRRRAIASLR